MNSKRMKWLIAILSIIVVFIIYLIVNGIIVFDHSAVRRGEGVERTIGDGSKLLPK